jgi:hypothetical protein
MRKAKICIAMAMVILASVLVAIVPVANAYEYSVTTIEDYSDSEWLGNLDPWGQLNYDKIEYWFHDQAGWTEHFWEKNDSVDEPDFGTSNSGYQGLDEADFHYHFGHGVNDIGSEIALHNWAPGWNYADVRAEDVHKKWDSDNKWVLIDCCHVLESYDDWAGALKYSHAILGFASTTYTTTGVSDRFGRNVIQNDMTIYDAYYAATIDTHGSDVIGAAIFDNEEQKNKDHLWGQGEVAADESPDDDEYWYYSWSCM